jgi:Ca-activated chloride channel family protein
MNTLVDTFQWPWLLLLAVILVPIVWWDWLRRRRRAALRISSTADLSATAHRSLSVRARVLLPILRTIAVLMIVLSLARPQRADELTQISTEGVALELVLDRSSSMAQRDLADANNRAWTRLDAVKNVIRGFVLGDGEKLEGRRGDLVGLTVFARYPDTVCPLTRDHEHLIQAMSDVEVPTVQQEDGTAIGDALLLGIERIRNIGRRLGDDEDFKVDSRAIILLTDGEQNAGDNTPLEAAEAAKALDIKVYAIGAAPMYTMVDRGLFGRQREPVRVDERTLKQVAEMTGGRYFRATDAASLADVYAEIDRLERSKIDEQRYYLYDELAYQGLTIGEVTLPPPLLIALIVLGLEALLANTWLRRVP